MSHAATPLALRRSLLARAPRAATWSAWVDAERGRFILWLPVAMVAGTALYFALRAEPPAWPAPATLAAALALALAARRHRPLRAVGLLLLAAAAGFAAAQLAAARSAPPDPVPARAVVLEATLAGVELLPDGRRLTLHDVRLAPGEPPLGRAVRVRTRRTDETLLAAGDRISVRALLRPPNPPAYPGAWDQQRDAWFGGLGAGGTALGPVTVLGHAPETGPAFAPAFARSVATRWQALRDTIAARAVAALPGTSGAVAATLLTGSARAIPEADRAAFRDSGLAHLLAVAGLHIGIVMGLVLFATRLALATWPHAALHWPTKPIAAATALAGGLLYLLLTGAHVPIVRSFAMAALVTLGIAIGRRALSLRALALAAAVIVVLAPQEVVGVSFQMSFAAVLALVAGYDALRPVLARLHGPGWRRYALHAAMLLLTSLIAGTASAPYGAYHFGHVQLYFIAANVLAVPLTAFWVLPLGILALILMPLGLDRLAFIPMGWGIDAIVWIARTVAAWPAAALPVPPMPGWGLAVFSLGLAWLCLWRTRLRHAGLAPMAIGLASAWIVPLPDILVSNDGRLVALRTQAGYALQMHDSASWFVRDAWRAHLAVDAWRPLGPDPANGACTQAACRLGPALVLRDQPRAPRDTPRETIDCTDVLLVVSAEPARNVCPGVALVDRFTVWRDGAAAVWIKPAAAPLVLTDRADRGDRPWVPPPPQPRRRTNPALTMAPAEPLPPEGE